MGFCSHVDVVAKAIVSLSKLILLLLILYLQESDSPLSDDGEIIFKHKSKKKKDTSPKVNNLLTSLIKTCARNWLLPDYLIIEFECESFAMHV